MVRGEIKLSTYEISATLIKNRFSKLREYVTAFSSQSEPLTSAQLRKLAGYNTELKKKLLDFESNLNRLLESVSEDELTPETLSRFTSDQDDINDVFIEVSGAIEELLPQETSLPPTSDNSSTSSTNVSSSTHVKLPKLELKTFDGSPAQWISFKNLFDSTIHNNNGISAVAKFQYLLSVLSNEPLNLIKSLDLSSENYIIAYDLLTERYHNPRRLTTLHLNHILDLPNISGSQTKSMRTFVNLFYEHTQALKALKCDVTSDSNPLLSALILRKMDQDLRQKLESYRSTKSPDGTTHHSLPDIHTIVRFLNTECVQVEDASLHDPSHISASSSSNPQPHKPQQDWKHSFTSHQRGNTTYNKDAIFTSLFPCFVCSEGNHKVYACPTFKSKSSQERHQLVKSNKRCFSCLGNHILKDCNSKNTCHICHKKHHTLLHLDSQTVDSPPFATQTQPHLSPAQPSEFSTQDVPQPVSLSSQTSMACNTSSSTVLLGTALVKLTARNGTTHVFRALLDSGSMCDFISEHAAQILGSSRSKSSMRVSGLAQMEASTLGTVSLDVETLASKVISPQHEFQILQEISVDLPRTDISNEVFRKSSSYVLADPTFHLAGRVDVLLGGALYPQLLTSEIHSLGQNLPFVIGTQLGFVVMGHAPCMPHTSQASSHAVSLLSTCDVDLHSSAQKSLLQADPPVYTRRTSGKTLRDQHDAANLSSKHRSPRPSQLTTGRSVRLMHPQPHDSSLSSSIPVVDESSTKLPSLRRKRHFHSRVSPLIWPLCHVLSFARAHALCSNTIV